jgi:hypothetical protein
MQQALDALLAAAQHDVSECADAIAALQTRLAQPEQEPTVWIQPDHLQNAQRAPFMSRVEPTQRCPDFVPLYRAPQPAVPSEPLTDEDIIDIRKSCYGGRFGRLTLEPWGDTLKFARAVIDAALKAAAPKGDKP